MQAGREGRGERGEGRRACLPTRVEVQHARDLAAGCVAAAAHNVKLQALVWGEDEAAAGGRRRTRRTRRGGTGAAVSGCRDRRRQHEAV